MYQKAEIIKHFVSLYIESVVMRRENFEIRERPLMMADFRGEWGVLN